MKVKNDYNRTLTNIAASVQQYFDLPPSHNTLQEVDAMLEKHQPKNVAVILLDGLGANILNRTLPKSSFLRQHEQKVLTTVFPATTTAATTSLRTGLNPVEHGYMGWSVYIDPIDKVITIFANSEKGHDEEICEAFLNIKNLFATETIASRVNKAGLHHAIEILPFGANPYKSLDDMLARVEKEAKKPGKRLIYAYDEEPDSTMHRKGPDSREVKALIKERDKKIAELATKLHDTLLIVLADHGHIKTRTIYLEDYPDVMELLAHPTSTDQRATTFKIKPGKKPQFEALFRKYFGKYYDLYPTPEVIANKLFGDGRENTLFRPALGDYLAIARTDVVITAPGDHRYVSHHAGYTDDEILIPFIAKYCS